MSQPLVSWPGALSWRPPAGLCVLYSLPVGWPPQGLSLGTGRQCMTGLRTPRTRPADQGDRRLAARPAPPQCACALRSLLQCACALRSLLQCACALRTAPSAVRMRSPPCTCSRRLDPSLLQLNAHAHPALAAPPTPHCACVLPAHGSLSPASPLLQGSASVVCCGARSSASVLC